MGLLFPTLAASLTYPALEPLSGLLWLFVTFMFPTGLYSILSDLCLSHTLHVISFPATQAESEYCEGGCATTVDGCATILRWLRNHIEMVVQPQWLVVQP